MRRTLAITAVVLGTATSFALAQGTASPTGAAQQQQQQKAEHKPCGQMIADNARYPEQLATVVTSVADMMEAHAKWAGTGSKQAKAEHDRIMKLTKMHRELASQAKQLSSAMRDSRDLQDAPHDMRAVPPALTQAMERFETESRRFAQMLNESADENARMRQGMMGGGMQRGTGGSGPQQMPSDPATPGDEREPGTGGSGDQPFPQDTGRPYEPPTPGDEREPGLGGRPPPVDPSMPGQTPSDRPDDSVPPTREPPRR